MSLSPEQTATVAEWVRNGASLSEVQKRLQDDFGIAMTYMDVRFLVDDLDLTLVDRAPTPDASDVTKSPPAAAKKPAAGEEKSGPKSEPEDALPDDDFPAVGGVTVEVDHATLHPGALASGSVTFSDGVTGKWIVDNYGRPGFTEVSQPDYRPSEPDAQAFMQELGTALRQKGIA